MADDEQGTSGMVSGLVQDFIAQLRAVTEGLEDLKRIPCAPSASTRHVSAARRPFRRRS